MSAQAEQTSEPLAQHLIGCPSCGLPAAIHVSLEHDHPTVVRVVCASGCPNTDALYDAVIKALYGPP